MKVKDLLESAGPDAEVFVLGDKGERIPADAFDYGLDGSFVAIVPNTHPFWDRIDEIMSNDGPGFTGPKRQLH